MGIREDMRAALGSIAAAVPESVRTMRHGDGECGAVVQTSSRDFAESVSESGPAEAARFVADGVDFPTLEEGAAVELDGSLRVVTSLKADPVGATFTVGLSAEFEKCPASYSGTRRENGAVRALRHPLDVLCLRSAADPSLSAEAAAFNFEQSYVVCVSSGAWPEVSEPRPGDDIEFTDPHRAWETVRLRVVSAVRHEGWWILRARRRGGA